MNCDFIRLLSASSTRAFSDHRDTAERPCHAVWISGTVGYAYSRKKIPAPIAPVPRCVRCAWRSLGLALAWRRYSSCKRHVSSSVDNHVGMLQETNMHTPLALMARWLRCALCSSGHTALQLQPPLAFNDQAPHSHTQLEIATEHLVRWHHAMSVACSYLHPAHVLSRALSARQASEEVRKAEGWGRRENVPPRLQCWLM